MQNDEQINTTDPTAPGAPVNPGPVKGKNDLKKWNIAVAIIGAVLIPTIMYLSVAVNGWIFMVNMLFFSFWLVFYYSCAKIIVSKCHSMLSVIGACFGLSVVLIAIAALFLLMKTGGNTFSSCADTCAEVTFGDGVRAMARMILTIYITPVIIFSVSLYGKKRKTASIVKY